MARSSEAGIITSIRLKPHIYQAIKDKNINLTSLVNDLLERHLFENSNNVSQEMLELRKLRKELEEVKRGIKRCEYIEERINEIEAKLSKKQEAKQIEENLDLIRELEHVVFDDIERLKATMSREDLKYAIERRLSVFAANHKISLPEAWDLFFKVFPGMKKELEV